MPMHYSHFPANIDSQQWSELYAHGLESNIFRDDRPLSVGEVAELEFWFAMTFYAPEYPHMNWSQLSGSKLITSIASHHLQLYLLWFAAVLELSKILRWVGMSFHWVQTALVSHEDIIPCFIDCLSSHVCRGFCSEMWISFSHQAITQFGSEPTILNVPCINFINFIRCRR